MGRCYQPCLFSWVHQMVKLPSMKSGLTQSKAIVVAKKAWMYEDMMRKWKDLILMPWRNIKGHDIAPILVPDSYHIHMMVNDANRIPLSWDWGDSQSCRLHIFVSAHWCGKQQMHQKQDTRKWEFWMLEERGLSRSSKGEIITIVAEWLNDVYMNILGWTVRKAWIKMWVWMVFT